MTESKEERFVDLLLEEAVGGLNAPDLRRRVLEGAGSGRRRRGRDFLARWAAAALLALGLGAVGFAAWQQRGAGGAKGDTAATVPGNSSADRSQRQGPEVVRPDSLQAFHELLAQVHSIRIHVVTAPPFGANVQGAPATVVADPTEVANVTAALRDCKTQAQAAAGWEWPHRIELVLESGAAIVCAVDERNDLLGVRGIGDVQGTRANLAPLRQLVERAAGLARRDRGVVYGADEFGADAVDPIPQASESLELWGLTDADLVGLDWFDSVRVLDLSHCEGLSDAAMAHVARLGTLEEIRFGYSSVTDAGLAKLAALPRLRRLNLSYNGGRDADGPVFTGEGFGAFVAHGALRVLGLTYCRGLTDAGLEKVAALPALEELDLSGRRMGKVTAAGLRALGACATLRDLDLSDCPLDIDAAMQEWSGLNALMRLDLSDTSVSAEGLRQVVVCEALEQVELDRCPNVDAEALAFVTYLPSLRTLHASRIPARGADLFHIRTAAKLEELRLDQTPITVEVARAIAHCQALRRLQLSFCSVDDACVAELARLPALEQLDLAGNRELTDAGLADLATLSTLRELDLNVCQGITTQGVAMLRESLPNTKLTAK